MTIQPLSNYYQIPSSVMTDFQNYCQTFGNLVGALKSGNQDQVTLSGNALLQAMTQFQADLTNIQQTGNNIQSQNSAHDDFRNLLGAVNSAVGAIKSGNQEQITASQNTLQQATTQFQTDLTNIQQVNNSSQSQNSTQDDFQNFQTAVNSLLDAQKSGNQDQINAANDAMQKAITQLKADVPALQQTQGHHHHHHHHQVNTDNNATGNNTFNSTPNNLLSFLAAFTSYGNNGQSQNTTNAGSLNLTV